MKPGAEQALTPEPAAPQPASLPAAPASATPTAGSLTRGMSNHALAAMLARAPAAAAPAKSDVKADMDALEARMKEVKTAASGRVTTLGGVNDDAVQKLQDASRHLESSSKNYKEAYKVFKGKLDEADERFEMEQAIVDSVQGVLVAAALAVLGPEMLVVGAAVKGLEAAAAKQASTLASAGLKAGAKALEGGAGEVGEQVAGKGVDSAKGDAVRPGSTAAGAGDTPGDRFEEAFTKLNAIVSVMPRLGKTIAATSDIATAAGDVALEAVRLAGGGTGRWTAEEAKGKGDTVATVNTTSEGDLKTARINANRVVGLANSVLNVPVKSVADIETLLWTNWMASLEGGKNEVLDNDVIQDYLTGKGMLAPGSYMSDADQSAAVTQARKDFLGNRGIEVGPGAQVDSLYRREMHLDDLKRRVIGKRGKVTSTNKVTIGDAVFDSPGMCGGQVGDEVEISFVHYKDHVQGHNINIAHWSDGDFNVMGNTVAALNGAGGG